MWTVTGIVGLVYVGYLFFQRIGNTLPILEFMLFVAGMQWILGPLIEYNTPFEHYKYHMYVPEEEYMGLVVPSFLLFTFILLKASKKFPLIIPKKLNMDALTPYALIFLGIGFVAQFTGSFLPGALAFFMVILSNFKFIGAIILFFSSERKFRRFFYGALILLIFTSLQSGFFHDLILWSVFFFMYWGFRVKPTMWMKVGIFIIGFFSITVIQSVKMQYRKALSAGYDGNVATLFMTTLFTQYESGYYQDDKQTQGMNVRLNQGWIISAVMHHVPKKEDFARGSTIREAIYAAALPRFLNPDKKIAGGRENFRKYTALMIGNNTSMGISIIGEFYANYGRYAIVAMGVWGLFLLQIWKWLLRQQLNSPFVLFFVPLLFLQVVKAETELLVVLNHLIKSIIVIFGFFYFTKHVMKWSIYYKLNKKHE